MYEPNLIPQSSGFNIGDIYDCLFRHKWKIVVCSLAGVIAAAAVYFLKPPVYVSQAKLFLRYVLESKPNVEPGTSNSQMQSPDSRGENIINSEIEILTSRDLAEKVVDAIGPGRILSKVNGRTNRAEAVNYVRAHVNAESPRRSNVIRITFDHPDPEIPQPVLTRLIDAYRQKHLEIHSAIGIFDEFLTQQTDQMRSRLTQTEDELRKLKQKAGTASVEESAKAYHEQAFKIWDELLNAEADLAERQAILGELNRLAGNKTVAADSSKPETPKPDPTPDKVGEYKRVSLRLDGLWKSLQDRTAWASDENAEVRRLQAEISVAEKQKAQLEQDCPGLIHVLVNAPTALPRAVSPPLDFATEATRAKALEAKYGVLTNQLDRVQLKAASLEDMESAITQLQRQRDLQATQFRAYSAGLEQARLDEALGAAKTANISQVEAPAPPTRDATMLFKILAGFLVGGFAAGLALAFASDKLIDQTLRRPVEVETRLRLPLFLSVPDMSRNGYRRLAPVSRKKQLPAPGSESAPDPKLANGSPGKLQIAPWDAQHALRPYFESLRDRLISYFEVRNMTHKPKLVAVTGCNPGSGATTLAAGLAAALSEASDENVLLVDMNTDHGAAHPFSNGQPRCDLNGVLENENRQSALIQNNLYLVTEANQNGGPRRVLPKRFMQLMPKLKASDYDYIIFDMPSMSQTSVTPRLAGFMDIVLLVIESEETNGEIAKRASDLLVESKANVSAVLNKRRSYVPAWLHHEW